MNREELRAAQAPLRDTYRADPAAAWTLLHADGDFRDGGITCTVSTFAGPVRAGLHSATGGNGEDACSGDMLLQALVACAGVTLRSVATAMGLDLGDVRIAAESHFDARGTLGLDRSVEVGVAPVTLTATIETDLDEVTLTRLARSTERYCVVGQSLKHPPTIVVRHHKMTNPTGSSMVGRDQGALDG
jgi:uncharacterized OsmC-like protein